MVSASQRLQASHTVLKTTRLLAEAANDNQEQPGDEERWWYSGFVRSGRLGSAAPKPALAPTAKPKVLR